MTKPPGDEERSFLSRWSRRKSGEEAEQEKSAAGAEAVADAEAAEAEREAEENRAKAEAVDLETLDYQSDYEVFMKPGVPNDLRGAALQRLWRSNPILANLDGMNEYDEDFRTPAGAAAAVVKTAWKVGKGFVTDDEKQEAAAAKEKPAEDPPSVETPRPEEEAEIAEAEEAPPAPEREAVPDEPEVVEEVPKRVALRSRLDLDAFKEQS